MYVLHFSYLRSAIALGSQRQAIRLARTYWLATLLSFHSLSKLYRVVPRFRVRERVLCVRWSSALCMKIPICTSNLWHNRVATERDTPRLGTTLE